MPPPTARTSSPNRCFVLLGVARNADGSVPRTPAASAHGSGLTRLNESTSTSALIWWRAGAPGAAAAGGGAAGRRLHPRSSLSLKLRPEPAMWPPPHIHGGLTSMSIADAVTSESRTFEADVSKLLHLMAHSVYSDREVFLRELISNAADACERLRFEGIADPTLLGDDPKSRITLIADSEHRRLTVEDNGIGMNRQEMVEGLGTIARSGTKAFMDRVEAAQGVEGAQLIGQFGVGFYSAFMVADRVDVVSRRAGSDEATLWSSDGKGSYTMALVEAAESPARGTRVIVHLMEDAASFAERYTLERIVRAQSGHVPVPIAIVEKPGAEPQEVADGAALWVKPRAEIKPEEYTDFYRSVAGQF